MKLLVVDDQDQVGEIIARIARQERWDATHVTTMHRLADVIGVESVDVLLIDYVLEGDPHSSTNGLTAIADLRSRGINIPAILFTGWHDLVNRQEAKKLGVTRILEKPMDVKALRESLVEARKAIRC
jgi:DNA-binding NtrC family response regulator